MYYTLFFPEFKGKNVLKSKIFFVQSVDINITTVFVILSVAKNLSKCYISTNGDSSSQAPQNDTILSTICFLHIRTRNEDFQF